MKMCWIDVTGRLGYLVAARSPLFRGVGGHNWEGWLSRFAEVVEKPPTSRLITVRLWSPRWSADGVDSITISQRGDNGLASRFHAISMRRRVSRSDVPDHHGWVGLGCSEAGGTHFSVVPVFAASPLFLAHSTESFTFHPHSQSPPDHGPIGLHANRSAGLYGTKPSIGLPGRPTTDFGPLKKSSSPLSKHQSNVATAAGNKWSVQQLEPLPAGFPLERTSRRVNAVGSIVAERITACLFERSIEAKYNDVEGKAKCRTSDYVSFRIRLFAATGDDASTATIVEVQRRKGSAFNFMKDCRAILDAAEGLASRSHTAPMPTTLKPVSAMSCLQGVEIDNDDDNHGQDIKTTEELLSMDRSDSNLLAMENLEELTSRSSTSHSTVRLATKKIVSGENESTGIRDAITSLLQHSSLQGDQSHLRTTKDEMETDYDERMHNLSLSVVHNALTFLADEGSLTELVRMHTGWFHDILIPVLIRDVDGARDRPHDAYLAAKCLPRPVRPAKHRRCRRRRGTCRSSGVCLRQPRVSREHGRPSH